MTAMSDAARYRASCAAVLMAVREPGPPPPSTPTTTVRGSGWIVMFPPSGRRAPAPGSTARGGPGQTRRSRRGAEAGARFGRDLQDRFTGVNRPSRPHVLREYALIADGERGALIGPDGMIAWLCAPRWDSPAVFSGLLGGQGRYAVTPSDPWNVWGGYYETGSLIWRSR